MAGNSRLNHVVLKIVQTCNLNCSYCYVYNMGDESWRRRPKVISKEVLSQLAFRIKEHCTSHGKSRFHVELHGGEPLLVGKRRLREIVEDLVRQCEPVQLGFSVQSNGLLLDEEWVDVLEKLNVAVGVSVDVITDGRSGYRVDHKGVDRTADVIEIIQSLRTSRPRFSPGVLCVVTERTDVVEAIHWFQQRGIKSFDLLLPTGNHLVRPYGVTSVSALADNFIRGFEYWISLGGDAPEIRTFELMLMSFFGKHIGLDALGGDLSGLCVVESDGVVGINDFGRMNGGILVEDRMSIYSHRLDEHVAVYELEGLQALSTSCRSCRYLAACGGGYLPHRFDGASYANPSIYCELLFRLAERMEQYLASQLPLHFAGAA